MSDILTETTAASAAPKRKPQAPAKMPEQTIAHPAPAPKEILKLPGAGEHFSVRESSFSYPEIDVVLPIGHSYEDTLHPEYWANHAHKLRKPLYGTSDRAGAEIILRTVDHRFYARLYVRAVGESSLVVAPIGQPIYFGPEGLRSETCSLRWNGSHKAFDVVRKSDGVVIASKLPTIEAAQSWVDKTLG